MVLLHSILINLCCFFINLCAGAYILYIKQNARSNRSLPLSETTKEKIRQWNVADLSLYQHFNKTLWKKIEQYEPDFSRDLIYFKQMHFRVYQSCVGDTVTQNVRRSVKRTYSIGFGTDKIDEESLDGKLLASPCGIPTRCEKFARHP